MSNPSLPARRGLQIRPLHVVGAGIIVLALVYGFFGFQDGFRSYTTSVEEAVGSTRSVQLAGFLGDTGKLDDDGRFTFLLQDENGEMVRVISDDPRPANFEQAISIVAIGRYDAQEEAFMADDLLVKCPSKYQEMQEQA
jgi:cytochrome c-type biogenesis protein CcmE